jgi:ABC-type Fe3+/spermidine/putrescine transport system ATPase subunit
VRRADRRARIDAALELVGLEGLGDRRPSQLSGGQQQRVALARALVYEPSILLLDEPLGALDRALRERMQVEIRRLHRRLDTTFICVTHDQDEAFTMSDRIVVMSDGRIEQAGVPSEVYERPASEFVATFVGSANLLPATVMEPGDGRAVVRVAGGATAAVPCGDRLRAGDAVKVVVRPERLRVTPGGDAPLSGVVADVTFAGQRWRYEISSPEGTLVAHVGERLDAAPGTAVAVSWDEAQAWVVRARPGAADGNRQEDG